MSEELKYNEPWILQRADPYVYRHTDGNYYFTASIPAYDRIVLRRSETLAGLKDAEEVTVWEKHKEGIMSEHIWATELHYLDGKWYIYFAGGDKDDIWAIRPYVLECADADPLTGTWTEKGKMGRADADEFSFEAFSLDATVFENKGKHYYVWAEKVGVGKQISNLYIGEMETPYKLKTVQVLLTSPDYDWERVGFWVNEGPAVIHHDGRIISLILHLRQALHTVWECLQQMKILIFLTRNPGQKNVIRFFVQMNPEESMDRGIIPSLKTKKEIRSWFIMREQKQRLKGIICTIQPVMPC